MTFLAIVSVSVISTCVLEFVGFGCSGGQYTRVCTQIAQLNLLTERDWMSLLNHVKLRFSWREFEHILKQIARDPFSPNAATVQFYYRKLATRCMLPIIPGDTFVQALQMLINKSFPPEGQINMPWTGYTMSHLQHCNFEDFSAAASSDETARPFLVEFLAALVETGVADDQVINVAGQADARPEARLLLPCAEGVPMCV